jgi:hypothetical protein
MMAKSGSYVTKHTLRLAVAATARWGRRYRRQQGVAASGGMRPG